MDRIKQMAEAIRAHHEAELNVKRTLRQVLEEGYGETGVAMAKEKSHWRRHKNGGGWVRDDAHVDPQAFLGPQSAVHGPETFVGPRVHVEGHAIIGAGVTATGIVKIDNSTVTGEPRKELGTGAHLKHVGLSHSEVSHAFIVQSDLMDSRVSQGVVENSRLTATRASGRDLNISDSTAIGAKIDNSVVAHCRVGNNTVIREALVVDTALAGGQKVEGVEMYNGHVKRTQTPDYAAYEAMERSGAAKRLRHSAGEKTR